MNCFNGEKYLKFALESIINQTYKNWELIFWDNQSKDKSANILKNFNEKRFKYFYSNEHTSLYKARNLAIEKSNGDFISFLDTDDLWEKNKLQEQIEILKDVKVGAVFSNFWVTRENIKIKKIYTKKKLPSGNVFDDLIKNYSVGILTIIIRKTIYLKLEKKFDERFSIIGDFDLFLRLSRICEFQSIQKPLAFYRLHGKNLSIMTENKQSSELELWLNENAFNLNKLQLKEYINKIKYSEFLNFKLRGKYVECLKMLFNPVNNLINFKNLIIFITPIFLLKKLLWYN